MGGPNHYAGQNPKTVHSYMNITEELYELRNRLLSDSIKEAGISDDLREEWIEVNDMLKLAIVKSSIDECTKQYDGQTILDFPKE